MTKVKPIHRFMRMALAALPAVFLLASCSIPPAPSDQTRAEAAMGRADAAHQSASAAAVDAAGLEGLALAAADAAQRQPTAALIESAAKARADAIVARRVAEALATEAGKADIEAGAKTKAAAAERESERAADAARWWTWATRAAGMAGVVLGLLVGAALARFATVKAGAYWGATIAITGLAVAGYGASLSWLPLVAIGTVAAVAVAGLVAWWRAHSHMTGMAIAASHALDVVEADPHPESMLELIAAKRALGAAVARAGWSSRFNRMRGENRRWGTELFSVQPHGDKS